MRHDDSRMVFEGLEERRMMSGGGDPSPTPPPQLIWPLVINGSNGNDVIKVYQSGLNIVVTNNGVTNYCPSYQISTISIYGNDGSDLIDCSGMGNKVYVEGGAQTDTIIGGSGNDTIYGGAPFTGMFSWAHCDADSIDGGAGNDALYGPQYNAATIYGGVGDDTIYASGYNDVLDGGVGNDLVSAGHGYNKVYGGLGDDTITGGGGDDSVVGGLGNDVISTGPGNDSVWGGPTGDQRYQVSDGADEISAGDGNNLVYGDTGDDTITGGVGNDTIWAGPGNDQIAVNDGYDSVFGESGNDSINGGAKNDFIDGGLGDDTISGGAGPTGNDNDTDLMVGGDGIDTVTYQGRFSNLEIHLNGTWSSGALSYDAYGQKQYPEHDYIAGDVENAIAGWGNDLITGNDLANVLTGDFGKDTISAAGGNDTVYGGYDDDVVHGADGNDVIQGGYGDDALYGEDGTDAIAGETGKDRLFGGPDSDMLDGGDQDDVLVALGGGIDNVIGGLSFEDLFWVGPEDSVSTNPIVQGHGNVHVVSSFSNGAPTELDGQDLADPTFGNLDCDTCNPFYSSQAQFMNVPLFQNGTPSRDDIDQNKLGDCYFLAPLAGIAAPHPEVIQRSIADLGDGTYAVRFFSGGVEKFYRVDAQLPVESINGKNVLCFAGAARGTLWGPIMEKAFCFFRTAAHSYASIETGTAWSVYDAFNLQHDTDEVIWNSKDAYMTKMRNWLQAGGIVSVHTDSAALGCDLASSHVYTVVSVSADLKSVTLRNPWHKDDEGFETGDPNDGYITISVDQFDDDMYYISYATL
jgi:Ca2+-binding RTX toxin-like protein